MRGAPIRLGALGLSEKRSRLRKAPKIDPTQTTEQPSAR